MTTPARLRGVSALREYFRTNQRPIYFVSPTAFNLLGINRWVRKFRYVCHYDSFEGGHPNVFVPADRRAPEFESIEEICNYLLRHPEVRSLVRRRGPGGLVTFVMFDEETEALAAEIGLRVAHPPAALRHRLDSKIVTTQLGNAAGVPSVPNVLGRAGSYAELLAARGDRRARHATWSCRCRTATRARPPSSSPAPTTGRRQRPRSRWLPRSSR